MFAREGSSEPVLLELYMKPLCVFARGRMEEEAAACRLADATSARAA
jgi:hypothetical protein